MTIAEKKLRESVERQLEFTPDVPNEKIGVAVINGVVTLSGIVGTYADKIAAEDATKRVYGVKAIANDLEVKPPAERTDTEVASAAVEALERNVNVPAQGIKLTVKKGWLTLEGTVDWWYQRQAAETAVRYLAGVRGLSNNIMVKARVNDTEVWKKIEEALHRSAELEARRIEVHSSGSTVTLTGKVRTWRERDEAQRAAWNAPGVTSVVNNIEVTP
ncbi:MAG: BON domain-containing protein [Acidobacteria bacterium]|nr:BON domain-containing protein [Acidobacteriota bacterium]